MVNARSFTGCQILPFRNNAAVGVFSTAYGSSSTGPPKSFQAVMPQVRLVTSV